VKTAAPDEIRDAWTAVEALLEWGTTYVGVVGAT
jgi:hypothetical protein